jgi:heptosyltransferase-3
VLAATHERAQAEPLFAAIPARRVIDLIGVDLLTAAAALRRTAMFVGNDTGLMHIAAASGIPTLGLFGPSPITQYAPWGDHCATAQTEATREALVGGGDFDHRTTDTLMDTLSVEAVETAARGLWSRAASKAA